MTIFGGTSIAQEVEIRKAVESQMHTYPESTLCDLYKNFFQDYFGPGHIISDETSADAYLQEELASAEEYRGVSYEPTGYKGNFIRINLSVIADGTVPYQVYFDAFIRSVKGIIPISVEEWTKEWQLISSVISEMDLDLPGYVKDSLEIENMLKSGEYVMHHSQRFIEAYDPHYRIIEKHIFEKEILPLIQKREQ